MYFHRKKTKEAIKEYEEQVITNPYEDVKINIMDKKELIKQYIDKGEFTLGADFAQHIADNSYTNEQQSEAYQNGFMDAIEIFLTLKDK